MTKVQAIFCRYNIRILSGIMIRCLRETENLYMDGIQFRDEQKMQQGGEL
jgi:hypothetical protein